MRELVSLTDETTARKIAAYLFAEAIPSTVDEDDGEWVIWIHQDDDRDRATEILREFQQHPDDPKYEVTERKVRHVLKEADRLRHQQRRQQDTLQRRWQGSWWHCYPATYIMIGLCVVVVALCTDLQKLEKSSFGVPRLCNKDNAVREKLFILGKQMEPRYDRKVNQLFEEWWFESIDQGVDPQVIEDEGIPYQKLTEIRLKAGVDSFGPLLTSGQFWRLVTPAFLHFDCLHILFNMMWLRMLGMGIEYMRGTRRFVTLCLILAVTSNVIQYFWSGPSFGGMSGVVFGLIGYVWMKGRTQPHVGLALQQQTVVFCMFFLLLCMTGALGPIANAAHLSGFVVGILIGARQTLWKRLPFGS